MHSILPKTDWLNCVRKLKFEISRRLVQGVFNELFAYHSNLDKLWLVLTIFNGNKQDFSQTLSNWLAFSTHES